MSSTSKYTKTSFTPASSAAAAAAASHNPSSSNSKSNVAPNARNSKTQHKTLGSLLRFWEGLHVAIELKTGGKIYQGILASADHDMTVTLENCAVSRSLPSLYPPRTATRTNNKKESMERDDNIDQSDSLNSSNKAKILHSVQIRGSQVRYIHFLDAPTVDLALAVKRAMERERAAAQKYKRGVRRGSSKKV